MPKIRDSYKKENCANHRGRINHRIIMKVAEMLNVRPSVVSEIVNSVSEFTYEKMRTRSPFDIVYPYFGKFRPVKEKIKYGPKGKYEEIPEMLNDMLRNPRRRSRVNKPLYDLLTVHGYMKEVEDGNNG
jgi:hypothetical protein